MRRTHIFCCQRHGVFLFDMDVLEKGYDAQNGHVADFLEHTPPLVEETHVAPELIDDDALDALSVVGCLQGDAAID